MKTEIRRIRLMNVPVDVVNMDICIEYAQQCVAEQAKCSIISVNPEKLLEARRLDALRSLYESDGVLLIPDGIGVVKAAQWLNHESMSRVAGADLMPLLCAMAERNKYSIFLFGATEQVNTAAAAELHRRFPDLKIAGRHNGYVAPEEMHQLINQVNESRAQLLFLALGGVAQELWIQKHFQGLPHVIICQGVGGTFDVLAGNVKRAPIFIQNLHLEWLYRLMLQPSRISRYSFTYKFVWLVLKHRFGWEK